MKRPGGFDRTPDRPSPETEPPRSSAQRDVSEAAPTQISRMSRVPVREPAPDAEPAAPVADPTPDAARFSDEHPTVDLGSIDERPRPGIERFRGRAQDPVREAERRLAAAARERKRQARRERRRFSAEARGRRRRWIIVLAAVGALVLFVAAVVFTPLMAVREVEVSGVESVNAGDVKRALERFEGRPLALIDDAEVHRALEPFPVIQRYAVERVPPHTLVVRIEERVPVISVAGAEGVELYDAAGVLLGAADTAPAGVPLGSGALTDLSSAAFRSASRALRDMPSDLRGQIIAASATSAQDVQFTLASGITVVWGDADDSRRKAVVLQAMLSSLADQSVERIDVSATEAPVFE
ncbi:FtsQ-type POTRA domain-containing protein [Leucobacter sp. USCH14]|uniref:FtsQ-type POTRA domain-containing protein n=1 Tax=Leucobacter sp. USCH14 TaxID=3024838 RepID=UPI0030AA1BB4